MVMEGIAVQVVGVITAALEQQAAGAVLAQSGAPSVAMQAASTVDGSGTSQPDAHVADAHAIAREVRERMLCSTLFCLACNIPLRLLSQVSK